MARHYSKRASKKRAYKKRRTIRRLRNTIRRKIQRGGTPEEIIIKELFKLLPGIITIISKNTGLFMQILTLLLKIGRQTGGSKFRREQRGGGIPAKVKAELLAKLRELKSSYQDNKGVTDCIDSLIDQINKADSIADQPESADLQAQAEAGATTESDALIATLTSEITNEVPAQNESGPVTGNESKIEKIKRILKEFETKITGIAANKISEIQSRTGMDIGCLNTLKTAILGDIFENIKKKNPVLAGLIAARENIGGLVSTGFKTFLNKSPQQTPVTVNNLSFSIPPGIYGFGRKSSKPL